MMFALSVVCASDDVSLATITVGFGTLNVLASAQDIAVDSWGLQLQPTYVVWGFGLPSRVTGLFSAFFS